MAEKIGGTAPIVKRYHNIMDHHKRREPVFGSGDENCELLLAFQPAITENKDTV